MKWFRFYHEALHDPKVLRLTDKEFRGWVNVLCVASLNGNRGELPSVEDIAIHLRVKPRQATDLLERLTEKGMLDRTDDGYRPHNWDGRQSQSDDVAERQRRSRVSRDKPVTNHATVTPLARGSAPASDPDGEESEIRSDPDGEEEGESEANTPPDINEILLTVLNALPRKFQADSVTYDEALQFGKDYRGQHADVEQAIQECRRDNHGLPFPQKLRQYMPNPDERGYLGPWNGQRVESSWGFK